MALVDGPLVEIPESDGWEDSLAARMLFVVTALLLFRMGFRLWAALYPEFVFGAVGAILLFATGMQLLVLAVSELDLEVWGPRISYAVLGMITITLLGGLWLTWLKQFGTDALLFSRAAIDVLASGGNPYTVDMAVWMERLPGEYYGTPRIDGTIVTQFSYPAGAVLWFLPQWLTVGPTPWGIRLTLVVFAVATSAVVIASLPPRLSILGVAAFLVGRNMLLSAPGGILWPLWLFPLVLGLRAWAGERWLRAAAWVGLSAATKQFAWLILPFLAIWQWHVTDGWRAFLKRAVKLNAVGAAVFLAVNGPFIIWNAEAWMTGVLTPLSLQAPMVTQGVGLAGLVFAGVVPLPTWWFSLATGVALVVSVTAYALYFEQLQWAAWLAPPLILFFHSRSLMSYYTPWGVVAVLGAAAVWGRLYTGGVPMGSAQPSAEVAAGD